MNRDNVKTAFRRAAAIGAIGSLGLLAGCDPQPATLKNDETHAGLMMRAINDLAPDNHNRLRRSFGDITRNCITAGHGNVPDRHLNQPQKILQNFLNTARKTEEGREELSHSDRDFICLQTKTVRRIAGVMYVDSNQLVSYVRMHDFDRESLRTKNNGHIWMLPPFLEEAGHMGQLNRMPPYMAKKLGENAYSSTSFFMIDFISRLHEADAVAGVFTKSKALYHDGYVRPWTELQNDNQHFSRFFAAYQNAEEDSPGSGRNAVFRIRSRIDGGSVGYREDLIRNITAEYRLLKQAEEDMTRLLNQRNAAIGEAAEIIRSFTDIREHFGIELSADFAWDDILHTLTGRESYDPHILGALHQEFEILKTGNLPAFYFEGLDVEDILENGAHDIEEQHMHKLGLLHMAVLTDSFMKLREKRALTETGIRLGAGYLDYLAANGLAGDVAALREAVNESPYYRGTPKAPREQPALGM